MPTTPAANHELRDFYNAYGAARHRELYDLAEELADVQGFISLAEVIAAEARLAGTR
jgi:hypothetical protein